MDCLNFRNSICKIGPDFAKGTQSAISYKNFLSGTFNQSIFVNLAMEEEIIATAKQLAVGYDKQSINVISAPLTYMYIVNLSIMHGIVPDKMKIAHMVPIFKSDDKAIFFSNYGLVSILPCFSKFLERIVYKILHVMSLYLNDFRILRDNQYGFKKMCLMGIASSCPLKFMHSHELQANIFKI